MDRRKFIRQAGAGIVSATALTGCLGDGGGDTNGTTTGSPTSTQAGSLTVATYSSFTGEGTAGNWLKTEFEKQHDGVTVEFETPENGVNQYIQRKQQGAEIDADLYVGLNTGELVRADEKLDSDLFAKSKGELENAGGVKEGLQIDPDGRAIPYDTGYISLVYNANEVENPETFEALITEEYKGALITQNAQKSDPGRAFLLWTIKQYGEDGYLDYWEKLLENDVKVLSDWEPAYNAYLDGEAPIVVSYSTDQVYYHGEDVDMQKHQVGFLNDQGYANPEGMALFADSDVPDLGRTFMDFMLTTKSQKAIAQRNVQFPAVEGVEPGGDFGKYAYEPPEPVTFTYDELAGNVETWIDKWAKTVASN